jgi:hypothetical protein
VNCEIISSEFPQRGELLGYYYYYKLHPFDKAVIMHDSVFIQQFVDFNSHGNVRFLWDFKHTWNSPENEITMLHHMLGENHGNTFYKLLMFYLEKRWKGCYGAQSVIRHTFLDTLVQKYSLIRLLDCIIISTYLHLLQNTFSTTTTTSFLKLLLKPTENTQNDKKRLKKTTKTL